MLSLSRVKKNYKKVKKAHETLNGDVLYNIGVFVTVISFMAALGTFIVSLVGDLSWLAPIAFTTLAMYGILENNRIDKKFEPRYKKIVKKYIKSANIEEQFNKFKDIIDMKTQEELYLLTLKNNEISSGHLSYIKIYKLIDKINNEDDLSSRELREFNLYIDFIILLEKEESKMKNFYLEMENKIKNNKLITL
jgi:hypothetical protein